MSRDLEQLKARASIQPKNEAELKTCLGDQAWRLNNLYFVMDKDGQEVPFRMNPQQWEVYSNLWNSMIILKVRQIGITTFVALFFLDTGIFTRTKSAVIIAHTRDDATEIFRTKVKYPMENLGRAWPGVKRAFDIVDLPETDQGKMLVLDNGFSFRVATSARSGTTNLLHVSEYGKICSKYPDKAKEIRTGSFESVPKSGIKIIESTAEGEEGDFYDKWQKSEQMRKDLIELGPFDWRPFFFPWYDVAEYVYEGHHVQTPAHIKYFADLDRALGYKIAPERVAWYIKKEDEQGADMLREYPSTAAEAFKASVEGAYYGRALDMLELQGRMAYFPFVPSYRVYTAWDIGMDDHTSIWFFQDTGGLIRLIDYFEDRDYAIDYYLAQINKLADEKHYSYAQHFLPHDARVRDWSTPGAKKRWEVAEELMGLDANNPDEQSFVVCPRPKNLTEVHDITRRFLQRCAFNIEPGETTRYKEDHRGPWTGVKRGLQGLKNYRKMWDKVNGKFRDTAERNWATHPASAFAGCALNYVKILPTGGLSEMSTQAGEFDPEF